VRCHDDAVNADRPQRAALRAGPRGLDRSRSARLLSGNDDSPYTVTPEDAMKTRRDFLTMTAGAVAAGATLAPWRAGAAPKAMTVVRESSFIKAFDDYFSKTLLPEYEKLTGIKMSYE